MRVGIYHTAGFFFILLAHIGFAQTYQSMKPKKPIICYAKDIDQHTRIDAPEVYQDWLRKGASSRTQTAIFQVTYNGFSPEAQAAFQKAVDIWSTLITSSVPIRVYANWQALGSGVLGSAIWGSVHANFEGAQFINTWYPVALAEKMAGQKINNDNEPDIYANFSSSANWYYGLDANPTAGKYDLVTVVLHELGHGLGIVDSYTIENDLGIVGVQGTNFPIIYDHQLENASGQNLYREFTSGTTSLRTQLISNNLYYNSLTVRDANGGLRARIYAPATFNGGSSIAHLDEASYPALDLNSLMTPQIGSAEAIHNPGPIVRGAFSDMGWVYTFIQHTSLKDSENTSGPFLVKAKIVSESGPIQEVNLNYTTGGPDITVAMTPTGVPNEYQASIPGTGTTTTYGYSISVKDNISRTYTKPGKLVAPNQQPQQFYTTFKTGPDTQAPTITHSPKAFILNTDTELLIEAIVADNLGLALAKIQYQINGVAQPDVIMTQGTPDSLYSATLNFGAGLTIGDQVNYKIIAVDNAVAQNTTSSPSTDFYTVNVTGLAPTQDFYSNDFDSSTDDFFGDGFSIIKPTGFNNPALHSEHPYKEGNTFPNQQLNLVYQLRIPVRVNADNPLMKFDEIVLVEPGDNGSTFGSDEFFDYVVVEGSKDGGVTWIPVADGYDSRSYTPWLTKFNSATSGNNSTAVGDPTLFRSKTLSLLNKFTIGDEVVIRFRLFSDPFAAGWGWAIDNLKIQIDESGPEILHDHIDFVLPGTTTLPLALKISDFSGVNELAIEFDVNNGTTERFDFLVDPITELYTLNLDISSLAVGDRIGYRIIARDNLGNETILPTSGKITVTLFEPAAPVSSYLNNFNTTTDDFIGNFFAITKPGDFNDNALHSTHNYPNGFGMEKTSSYSYILKKPIIINSNNPYISFDEIAIVEGHATGVEFGTAAFNDYVIVEGSIDGGITWLPFVNGYDAQNQPGWLNAFSNGANGTASLFKQRVLDLTANGNFNDGDAVLIRFRLFVNGNVNGWGWAIDNLSVQGPITSVEEESMGKNFRAYPNPTSKEINIHLEASSHQFANVIILNAQGQVLHQKEVELQLPEVRETINVEKLTAGIYLIKANIDGKTVTRKFIKK
ncbi:MAG: T9SS type A sorting domain-containing protein [Cyclobacteriaceae bacterium]|nr:T9SS type A sorting domain-containing protein [Cyclobacteriaceae bacterium]